MTMAMAGTTTGGVAHSGALEGPQGRKPRRVLDPARVLIYTVLIVAAIFYLFPLYVMIITSIKDISVIRDGNLLRRNMRREYLTESELISHLRKEGVDEVREVKSACIESDGRISVVRRAD